jgi:hypothetical protein
MIWPWGGHNDDVATVAMLERPLGPVKVTLQQKKIMTIKSYKLFTVLNQREVYLVSCHTCSVLKQAHFRCECELTAQSLHCNSCCYFMCR